MVSQESDLPSLYIILLICKLLKMVEKVTHQAEILKKGAINVSLPYKTKHQTSKTLTGVF